MAQLIKSLQRRSLNKEPKGELGFGNALVCPSLAGGKGDGAVPKHTREDLATPAWDQSAKNVVRLGQIHPQSSALQIH